MLVKTPDQLIAEIQQSVSAKEACSHALTSGKLHFHSLSFPDDEARDWSPVTWVLRAQLGTLDKLKLLCKHSNLSGTYELLATARNLFENLVWLRLFNLDVEYGLVFYEQLLKQQKQNLEGLLAKIEAEVRLFEEYDELDSANLFAAFDPVLVGNSTAEEIASARERHDTLTRELDERIRRTFSLYAATAKFNGYGYQCHLLKEQEVPRCLRDLDVVKIRLSKFEAEKPVIMSSKLQKCSVAKWNWKRYSAEVGMTDRYEFLYRYTSRLLHCTPMNLITEKQLTQSEELTMLEYVYVSTEDIFDAIEAFSFKGEIKAFLISTSPSA